MSTSDRIEKRITLRAPRTRVWRALTDAEGGWAAQVENIRRHVET